MTRFLGLAYADSAKAKAANKKLCCYPLGTKLFNKATAARSVDSFHDNIAEKNGGGMYIQMASSVNVLNSNFFNNRATISDIYTIFEDEQFFVIRENLKV